MEEISFDQIEQIWAHNDKPTQLYIHSAFCKSICKYCAYKGHIYDEALYKKYFFEHLPSQIEKYKHIIDSQNIHSIYFGGGTPNTEEDLANLEPTFKLLHDVKFVEKVIELHIGLPISDKTIEVLKRENFTTVILCIQTFDKEKLKAENRVCIAQNNLDELIGKFHKAGIKVGTDFIDFPDDNNRIVNDVLAFKAYVNKPDEITVAQLYANKKYEHIYAFFTGLTGIGYLPEDVDKISGRRCWRFIHPDSATEFTKSFYSFMPYLTETGAGRDSYYTCCLGIGSTTGMIKQTYSRVGYNTYYEEWDGTNTKYYIRRCPTLKQLILNSIDKFPDNIPSGSTIEMQFFAPNDYDNKQAKDGPTLNVKFTIPSVKIQALKSEEEKFRLFF